MIIQNLNKVSIIFKNLNIVLSFFENNQILKDNKKILNEI